MNSLKRVRAFQIELEFGSVSFWGERETGVPGEKPFGGRERTNSKLNPHMAWTPGVEPGPHWWEASALTTAPPLLPEFGREEARIHSLIVAVAAVVPSSGRRAWTRVIRDFKIQRRGRQREGQKTIGFYKQNNNFARASRFFLYFFARFCTTSTWKCPISRFMEDINKQRRHFISLFELGYWP